MSNPDPGPTAVPPPRKRSVGRILGIIAFGLVAVVLLTGAFAAGFGAWTLQRSFPQVSGEIELEGLGGEVTVQRDGLGIPVITARSSHDLFFAQGYVHAQDRFWEMDFRRHVTSGRLSELFGESQLPTDRFLRTLGWRKVAEQEVAALDPTILGYYESYADGVNAYLADHEGAEASLEYAVLGLQNPAYEIEPWAPADSVAWLKAMAWDLRDNIESETQRALLAPDLSAEQLAELYPAYPYDRNPVIVPTITPPPTEAVAPASVQTTTGASPTVETASVEWTTVEGVVEAVSELVGGVGEGIGSNSWVVSGDLTESGMPLLANDPHLGASLPSVWHQIGLRCLQVTEECPFDLAGFGFSGMPGIVIGHNADIAWGFTNLTTDVTDLYLEKLDGDAYWRDGALVPLEQRTETLKVAGGDPEQLEIRSTVHGPIISDVSGDFGSIAERPYTGTAGGAVAPPADPPAGEDAIALQWTALQPGTTASAIFALGTARNFDDFRAAAALFDVPAQNLVYADIAGNIGYQTPGRLPIRGAGDGSLPQPGWDPAYDWKGFIPAAELPVAYNPPEGYIVTANNAVVGADYPYLLTRDWDYGWRAARITELLQRAIALGPLTADDMRDIQADEQFWIGIRLSSALHDVTTGDEKVDAALELLRSWDVQNDTDSAPAAYANALWDELVQNLFVRGRETGASLANQGRLFLVVDRLLDDPESAWWENPGLDVSGRAEMLERSAVDAYERLAELQGDRPDRWNWGTLHALPLRNGTFGESGIQPIEWLFNRGPYAVAGGSSVVNATGWDLGDSFETITVPSMRMIVDLSDFDASRWNQLTGQSGHAFHENYVDQTPAWQRIELTPWAFSPEAVTAATMHTLTLVPAS
ncbi:penicillin acylase family protein [Microbacterium sp. BK668]|uniref:penicillin acylase family protein n=1 Tax=Microbacterium sp. BK668 TaxID=2512118 RepID=UPI0010620559|nr:penicillin acylase family protein [Microbacterium sp. BK668]TDN91006.1 penicillin amidase [Microbacterium sp. BK668]